MPPIRRARGAHCVHDRSLVRSRHLAQMQNGNGFFDALKSVGKFIGPAMSAASSFFGKKPGAAPAAPAAKPWGFAGSSGNVQGLFGGPSRPTNFQSMINAAKSGPVSTLTPTTVFSKGRGLKKRKGGKRSLPALGSIQPGAGIPNVLPMLGKAGVAYGVAIAFRAFLVALTALAGLPKQNKGAYLRAYLRYFFTRANLVDEPLKAVLIAKVSQKLGETEQWAAKQVHEATTEKT